MKRYTVLCFREWCIFNLYHNFTNFLISFIMLLYVFIVVDLVVSLLSGQKTSWTSNECLTNVFCPLGMHVKSIYIVVGIFSFYYLEYKIFWKKKDFWYLHNYIQFDIKKNRNWRKSRNIIFIKNNLNGDVKSGETIIVSDFSFFHFIFSPYPFLFLLLDFELKNQISGSIYKYRRNGVGFVLRLTNFPKVLVFKQFFKRLFFYIHFSIQHWWKFHQCLVSTRHCFDIHTTSITLKQCRSDVKITSCAYWVRFFFARSYIEN